jgi:hypothetical protein
VVLTGEGGAERAVVALAALQQGDNKGRAVWCRIVKLISSPKDIPQCASFLPRPAPHPLGGGRRG